MQKVFGWNENQFAWFGGYAVAAELISDETRWKNYVSHSLIETSISKDILMLTRVDKPALMKRLFELGVTIPVKLFHIRKYWGNY